jgi:hypothetical protein
MCRDWTGDHEIRADEEAEYVEFLKIQQAADFDAAAAEKPEPTDEELEAMLRAMDERKSFEHQGDEDL